MFFSCRCTAHATPQVCGAPRGPMRGIAHQCILHLLRRSSHGESHEYALVRVRIPALVVPELEDQEEKEGNRAFHEVKEKRRRRRCEKEDGGKLEGVLWRGALDLSLSSASRFRARGATARAGRGVQGSPTAAKEKVLSGRATAPMMMTVVVAARRWKGRERGDEAQERQRESPAQRGPVRCCMADLETRSPQGETRGPKRRPRRIGRNSRESRLFLFRMLAIARARALPR